MFICINHKQITYGWWNMNNNNVNVRESGNSYDACELCLIENINSFAIAIQKINK